MMKICYLYNGIREKCLRVSPPIQKLPKMSDLKGRKRCLTK